MLVLCKCLETGNIFDHCVINETIFSNRIHPNHPQSASFHCLSKLFFLHRWLTHDQPTHISKRSHIVYTHHKRCSEMPTRWETDSGVFGLVCVHVDGFRDGFGRKTTNIKYSCDETGYSLDVVPKYTHASTHGCPLSYLTWPVRCG